MLHASNSTAKALAVAISGAATFAAFPAAAQQVALSPTCARYTDPGSQAQCTYNEALAASRARAAQARQESAQAQTEASCQEALLNGVGSGRFTRDGVRAAYAGRPAGSVSACVILNTLTKS